MSLSRFVLKLITRCNCICALSNIRQFFFFFCPNLSWTTPILLFSFIINNNTTLRQQSSYLPHNISNFLKFFFVLSLSLYLLILFFANCLCALITQTVSTNLCVVIKNGHCKYSSHGKCATGIKKWFHQLTLFFFSLQLDWKDCPSLCWPGACIGCHGWRQAVDRSHVSY